ncbi:C39 family peptidase [Sphaerisporangium sp. TRM90804]|uniref:C39 family peptidase n=1 Tax=Sphaerisporangium sp. TRM90804 TaxID=3031113 RepID=UPI0024472DD8|nr:C39 family peptidase [Sphaerisporangium sp. TRM90804]MDH2430700.1 C39 family peptidase [Sphaerisporangium sp. TRM90804]
MVTPSPADQNRPGRSRVAFHRWTEVVPSETGATGYLDPFGGETATWAYTRWTSEERAVGFPATELVPSWVASAPKGAWIRVELRARTEGGRLTKWYDMGRWAEGGEDIHRTSLPGQGDEDGDVAVDTFVATRPVTAYRLRVTLHGAGARVHEAGVMASAVPTGVGVPVSAPGEARGVELDVPPRSQRTHAGHYPQWGGGGESWCSPASMTMVMQYWGRGPDPAELAFVDPADPCPAVDHAARDMYDHSYQGTGNWPFGVAYAGRYGLRGLVTRLRSLTEVERFIAAGVPVLTSQSFRDGELPGSGYSTGGHIMVVTGFTPGGDVVANDPAALSDETVKRTYPRAAFEHVWLRGTGSGGIVHVVHPHDVPLPPSEGNW